MRDMEKLLVEVQKSHMLIKSDELLTWADLETVIRRSLATDANTTEGGLPPTPQKDCHACATNMQVLSAQGKVLNQRAGEIETLKQEIEHLKGCKVSLEDSRECCERENNVLRDKNKELTSQVTCLEKEADIDRLAIIEMEADHKTVVEEFKRLQAILQEKARTLKNMEHRVHQVNQLNAALDTSRLEVTRMMHELEKANLNNKEYSIEMGRLQTILKTTVDLLGTKNAEIERLKSK